MLHVGLYAPFPPPPPLSTLRPAPDHPAPPLYAASRRTLTAARNQAGLLGQYMQTWGFNSHGVAPFNLVENARQSACAFAAANFREIPAGSPEYAAVAGITHDGARIPVAGAAPAAGVPAAAAGAAPTPPDPALAGWFLRPNEVFLEIDPTSGVTAAGIFAHDPNDIRRSIFSSGFGLFLNSYDAAWARTGCDAWLVVDGMENYSSMNRAFIQGPVNGDNHLPDHRTFDSTLHPR